MRNPNGPSIEQVHDWLDWQRDHCPDCNRALIPAPARSDGEPTTVGFMPCVCSKEAWSNSVDAENGVCFEDYHDRKVAEGGAP